MKTQPGVDRSLLVFGKKQPMSNRVLKFFADPGAKYFTIFVLGIATLLTAISITLIIRDNGRYKEHNVLEPILDTRNGTIILFDEARIKK